MSVSSGAIIDEELVLFGVHVCDHGWRQFEWLSLSLYLRYRGVNLSP
ncbi:MAG: hypothetical protein V7K35_22595 [Nostoc sp.]